MALITTFGTLKSEILAIIGRTPADPSFQMVTREINRDLRIMAMESTTTLVEAAEINIAPSITGATQANPCVITAAGHGFATGAVVRIHLLLNRIPDFGSYDTHRQRRKNNSTRSGLCQESRAPHCEKN